MEGFTLYAKNKDYFFETKKVRKTRALAKEVIRALNGTGDFDIPDNASGIDTVFYYLQRATCEIRTFKNGRQYYEISGENFGGNGSFVGDGKTVIIKL